MAISLDPVMTLCKGNNKPCIRRRVRSYLRVGRLLHAITLLEILLLAIAGPRFLWFKAGSDAEAVLDLMLLAFLASLPVFSQLDARSRFQSYKRVKDQFHRFGFDTRIAKPFLKSRCQRDAALVAADDIGHKTACRSYFRLQGYRWYHILPDFVFSNPGVLISRRFWRYTFFLETYRPKTNF